MFWVLPLFFYKQAANLIALHSIQLIFSVHPHTNPSKASNPSSSSSLKGHPKDRKTPKLDIKVLINLFFMS
jgi:hypothetical protein